jgi:hypothetical protein
MLKRIFRFPQLRHLPAQLELQLEREPEPDRNWALGGRSFYFFDFDDNLAFLATPAVLFHKHTGKELFISSGDFAQQLSHIGRSGVYQDYEIRNDDVTGTYRFYRDYDLNWIEKLRGKRQRFLDDVAHALGFPDFHWKGPSWSCFYHATFNQRPTAVITARGHHPNTIKRGISMFVGAGHLPRDPNYLAILPVNYPPVRLLLAGQRELSTAELKKAAIRRAVDEAIGKYGHGPHRFGMSDDDPRNLHLIEEQMTELKALHPQMSFFVIHAAGNELTKREIFG